MLPQIIRLFKFLDAETIKSIDEQLTRAYEHGFAKQSREVDFIKKVQQLCRHGKWNGCLYALDETLYPVGRAPNADDN